MPTTLTSKKSAPEHEKKAFYRAVCQKNLYQLARYELGYSDMTDHFHRPMLLWSQTEPTKKKLTMAARGTYKSSGVDIAKRVQYILNGPEKCSLLGSNKADNAQAFLKEITGHLSTNEKLMWAFPEILWTNPREQAEHYLKGAITVKRPKGTRPRKEATIETNGVEGELVSKHFEHGTFDDLEAKENSQTRPERQKVISWYEAAQALIDQPTPELATQDIINTPWDYDGLCMYLLDKRRRKEIDLAVYFIPCWVPDPNGTEVPGRGKVRATFPEKLSIPTLLKLRKGMPLHFAAQYELTPADQDTAVFKRLPADEKHLWGIPAVKPRREQPAIQSMWLAMTIDPAISVKGWADYSAISVCGWDHENNQHVLWLKWGKWEPTELIEQTYRAYNYFASKGNAPSAIGFEAIAFQRLFLHLFTSEGQKRNQFLPITKLERDTKNTKQTRQLVLEPGWNAGEIVLYDDLDALADLLDMANKFRTHKELTRDDLLDVLADNHQLRVRPHAHDPIAAELAHLSPEDADRARFVHHAQEARKDAGAEPLDAPSLKMAWAIQRRAQQADEDRQLVVAGYGEDWA